jgi:hypothetical protein
MTQWGFLLLCVYIALGVGGTTWRKAGRLALVATMMVVGLAMAGYLRSTPTAPAGPSSGAGPSSATSQAAAAEAAP